MKTVSIPDALYVQLTEMATESGMSVDQLLADLITDAVDGPEDNYDHLFTPEVMQELDRIDAGAKTYSLEEVDEHMAEVRKEWQAKNLS